VGVDEHRDLWESREWILVRSGGDVPAIYHPGDRMVMLIDEDDALAEAVVHRMIAEGVRLVDDFPGSDTPT
jgi:hypothetical protein